MEEHFSKALQKVYPVYEIPDDDLIGEVLVPAMSASHEARIAAGFFTSQCLAQIAPGLAMFLQRDSACLYLLISPAVEEKDLEALRRGITEPEQAIKAAVDRLFHEAALSERALVHHTLDCLAYLVASRRLVVRFALMSSGMYHKKQWLLRSGDDWLAVHGSGNATTRGLLVNGEQMTVDRPWSDGVAARARVERLLRGWDRDWANRSPHVRSIELPDALRFLTARASDRAFPSIEDFWRAWHADSARGLEPALPPGVEVPNTPLLAIPDGVQWREGRYAHQGRAVDAFQANGSRGILAVATGGGKTQTALIAATLEQDRHRGPALILVIVPSEPLMRQWARAVREFGANLVIPSELTGPQRAGRLQEIRAGLSGSEPYTSVLVCTQKLYTADESLRAFLETLPGGVLAMLIGDEVHNLGSTRFLANLPMQFTARLGLSATPERQYDTEGTAALREFFGAEVFEFGLRDAIAAGCLTPYNYHLHVVELSEQEMTAYADLTRQLRRKGFSRADDGRDAGHEAQIEHLLRKRRAVLEQAEAKIPALERLLLEIGVPNVARTLIYTSAKPAALGGDRQLDQTNDLLRRLGVVFHEFTSTQTAKAASDRYLELFGEGSYQVLTAMKVLDEGIDIPQTDTAFLLASSTVRREWVQRRGRILRQAEGKRSADLHDFLVVPPRLGSPEEKSVLQGELARAREFADTADNEYDTGGPREVIRHYEQAF